MFYLLLIDVPFPDVVRLLAGRLDGDTDEHVKRWVARGREPVEPRGIVGSPQQIIFHTLAKTAMPNRDPTPAAVQAAAYRVDARRSVLRTIDELTLLLLMGLGLIAVLVALAAGVVAGIVVAAAGSAGAVTLQRKAHGRARELIEWRQGNEPLLWALYYPVQVALHVVAVDADLRAAGQETPGERWARLDEAVQRDPDGSVRAGQWSSFYEAGGRRPTRAVGHMRRATSGRSEARPRVLRCSEPACFSQRGRRLSSVTRSWRSPRR